MKQAHLSTSARRLPPLAALCAFEAAARHLSFKRAAEELAVTPTAISHHVRRLESLIGVRLFERHAHRLALTREGEQIFPTLRDGFDAIARALEHLGPRQRSFVTLSATTAFTAHWLLPRVATFQAENPLLDLRLHASDDSVDLHAGGADAAIRYGKGGYAGLEAEPLLRDTFAPVCSPRLSLRRPEQLSQHTLIHFEWRRPRRDNPTWRRWFERAGLTAPAGAELVFTNESHAIQAAVAGQGVALLSSVLVAEELARGTLTRPFGPELDGFEYCLVFRPDAQRLEHIAALRAWLASELLGAPRA